MSSGLSVEPGEETTPGGPRGIREDNYYAEALRSLCLLHPSRQAVVHTNNPGMLLACSPDQEGWAASGDLVFPMQPPHPGPPGL